MEAEIMMGMTARVRQLVVESWPDRTAQWDAGVWDRWAEELRTFTESELEKAVRYYARQGSEWPPTWGVVYSIARPLKRARLARIEEYRYQQRLEEER